MSNDINKCILIGRLTREPELKSLPSGSYVVNFSLAVNRTIFIKDGENRDEVGFFNCVAFGKLAEVISKYAQKGRRVGVDGSLRWSSWEDNEGKKQSKVEIYVENFQFLDVRQDGENEPDNNGQGFYNPPADDPDIPF